jgi:aminopeptidase YwaD
MEGCQETLEVERYFMENHLILLRNHMTMLCETIGARPTGSVKNKAAVDYAYGVLQKCGLQVRKQSFDCIDWENSGATLLVDGQSVPVEPAEYSLPCSIEKEFICIDTVAALQKAELSGRIAVLYGELCDEPLMPKNFEFYNPDEHKQIIALLEEKNPIAIITISTNNEHIIQDGDFSIPCAVVCADMLDTFLQSVTCKAKLIINTKRIPTEAHNMIATHGAKNSKVCFSAHIDTKPAAPGALDNASGVSVLLALAESLSEKEYPFQIEFALLNGEDYYSVPGEMVYMGDLTPEYKLSINVDGIGLKGSPTSISFYECPQKITNWIIEHVEKATGIEQIEPWPMGDHMIFATAGIQTIALTASSIFNLIDTVIHTTSDDMKNIDFDILKNAVEFLLSCVEGWENDEGN